MDHSQVAVADELTYYQQMIDAISEYMVIRLDRNGRIETWHEGASRLTGYPREEAIGQPVTVFYTEDDVASGQAENELRTAARTGRYESEGWRVRKDGTTIWAAVSVSPVRKADGSIAGYVKVVREQSERREREVALLAAARMLDSITDYGVIRLDRDGMVQSWNPGARTLRQYAEAEVLGHHVSIFYSEEDVRTGLPERELAAAARDGRFETEGWRTRRDGSRFWASVIFSPIVDDANELVGFVEVARDLTDKREQEQLVARQRDEILELSTPVIQVWDNVLVLPIIGTLDSLRASRLTESLLERIAENQSEVVILDVSGVPAIDTDVAQHLLKTVEAARLMGAASILSGVRPETAQAIVHLGIELGNLRSRNNLKDALQLALRLVGAATHGDRVTVHA
jgi:rsbT co-antagonist protein RsbR